MTPHPDWTEPRHIPALTQWFCADLKQGVPREHHLGLAHKIATVTLSTRIGDFCWLRRAWFGREVEHYDEWVGGQAERPVLPALRPPLTAVPDRATPVRLGVCAEAPIIRYLGFRRYIDTATGHDVVEPEDRERVRRRQGRRPLRRARRVGRHRRRRAPLR